MQTAAYLDDLPESPPPVAPRAGDVPVPHISQEFLAAIRARLNLLVELSLLATQRDALAKTPDLPANVAAELERQSQELTTSLPLDQALATFHQLQRRLNSLYTPGGRTAAPTVVIEALQLGVAQARLLARRAGLTGPILTQAARLAADQPLYGLLLAAGAQPQALFGWAIYALTLEAMQARCTTQLLALQPRTDQSTAAGDPAEPLRRQLSLQTSIQSALARELAAIEKPMVDAFWAAYEEAAAILASPNSALSTHHPALVHLRAFLRYGMLGGPPWFLPAPLALHILQQCDHALDELDASPDAAHICHADEYIDLIARGHLTPSVDEAHELKGRQTPADLARREARQIRRVGRLCNKLQEPFLPLALRRATFGTPGMLDRQSVTQQTHSLDQRDPGLFGHTATQAARPHACPTPQSAPCFLILPGPGELPVAWNPRSATDPGKLVLPGYTPRPELLPTMFLNLAADFRWDSSRESASTNARASAALAAAYATIRWNHRHDSPEARESAGIHLDENDRKNFRRHYALFMQSEHDGSIALAAASPELYDLFVQHLGRS